MSNEENKTLARRFADEVFNQGNVAVVDDIFSPTYVNHTAPMGVPPNREGTKGFVMMFRAAFPDLHINLDDIIAEGDKVVTRWTVRGTHQAEFLGIPPTGKTIVLTGMDIMAFSNGKITEHWDAVDNLGLLQQLGVAPMPG